MSWTETLGLAGAILGSLGGGSIIVFAASNWLGKVWANRILEKEKAELQRELEHYKTDLQKDIEKEKTALQREIEKAKVQYQLEAEKNKAKYIRYSETQFKMYNDLWHALCQLEEAAETLWDAATVERLMGFATKLHRAKNAIKVGYLVIETSHYQDLMSIIRQFEEFKFGKERLIRLRMKNRQEISVSDNEIQRVIDMNSQIRDDYINLLESVAASLKRQIAGR
jgi:hypothetical protein